MKGKSYRALIVSLIAALLIFIPVLSAPQTTEAATSATTNVYVNDYTKARQLTTLVNARRKKAKVPELIYDSALEKLAMIRARELVTKFSSIRPNGESGLKLIPGNVYKGENIAKGQTTAASVDTAFYNSAGHRANIIKEQYRSVGFGCVKYNNCYYWIQLFSSQIPTTYTGFALKSTWNYYEKGAIASKKNGIINGRVNYETTKWYVKNGKVDFSYTGLAKGSDSKWYYVVKGKHDKNFVGLSASTTNSKKVFYVKNGVWQSTYSGKIKINNKTYTIKNGKVA